MGPVESLIAQGGYPSTIELGGSGLLQQKSHPLVVQMRKWVQAEHHMSGWWPGQTSPPLDLCSLPCGSPSGSIPTSPKGSLPHALVQIAQFSLSCP